MQIVIELSESDLDHFRGAMRRAREAAASLPAEEVIAAAESLFRTEERDGLPEFVKSRLDRLGTLIALAKDTEWKLTDAERSEVLSALTYFADPNDAIPDTIPVLGFLDDAIMIELVCEEMRDEIQAYEDFLGFKQQAQEEGSVTTGTLEEWLAQKQIELLERMRERRGSRRHSYVSGGGGAMFRVR